jgi:endonuclease-3
MEREYTGYTTALEFSNPFELLIATILSAQTTDKQVNKLTGALFRKYPTPDSIAKLTEEELAGEIKGCGLYRNKARNIIAACRVLIDRYGGEVPRKFEDLINLPGVGRKTANVVLANAFGIPALGVDTHVFRVAKRLHLAEGKNAQEVEKALTALIPAEKWSDAHHWFIWHGRKVCRARNPLCNECILNDLCPEENTNKNS